jgi:hypothetical protein
VTRQEDFPRPGPRGQKLLWASGLSWTAACLLVTVGVAGPPCASAQSSMQTILTNGPSSNRLNIVVLSEGYKTNELAQFLVDATNAVNTVLGHPPYQEYRNYFNAFAIKVASNQSGCDHPADYYRDTYFNSTFDVYDNTYSLMIPSDSSGQGKVDTLLTNNMPNCPLPILLVNDGTQGGSDGFNQTAIASTAALEQEMYYVQQGLGPYILTHETAHILANLGDEYTIAYPGFPDTEEPNTTTNTSLSSIKWRAWIATNTPVPTPESYGNGVVGLFEGAHYHATGWYRPQLDCAMRSGGGPPFCAVCSEALVLAIYRNVRPVEAFSPASTNLSATNTQALNFSLALLHPATHNLSVQWFTNGTDCTGVTTNSTFTLLPQSLPNGSNWVRAVVTDNTPLVRTGTNLLSQSVTWALNVSIPQLPQLRLDSPLSLSGGRFAFRVSGVAPQGFVIQGATNLSGWLPLTTNFLVGGQFWYTNSEAGSFRRQFYRALLRP